jgi:parvulin-like peptidyl-prolyl isomerase
MNYKMKLMSIIGVAVLSSTTMVANDTVYATVNGENITAKDIAQVLKNPQVKFENLQDNQKTQLLNSLIEQKLLAEEAYKSGIPKTKEYKEQLDKLKKNLAFQMWIEEEMGKVTVTDAELKKYYNNNIYRLKTPEQYKASHILVKLKSEADEIIKKLQGKKNLGSEFAKMAKEKSIGPSGTNGGALGWFTSEKMVPEFSNAAANLEKGTITKTPVKTNYGYHVIFLEDKKDAQTMPFDKIKDQLKQEYLQKKFTEDVKKKAEALKKNAKITFK